MEVVHMLLAIARTILLGLILLVLAYSACVHTSQVRVPVSPQTNSLRSK